MNKQSWVRNLLHFELSNNPIVASSTVENARHQDDTWSAAFEVLDDLPDIIKSRCEEGGHSVSDYFGSQESLNTFLSEASMGLYETLFDDWWIEFLLDYGYGKYVGLEDYKTDHSKRDVKVACYIQPMLAKTKTIANDLVSSDITWNVIWDVPGVACKDKDGNFVRVALRSLGGYYEAVASLLESIAPCSNDTSKSVRGMTSYYHELLHCVLKHLNDNCLVKDAMYGGNDRTVLEETMVHFMTDCQQMSRAMYDYCTNMTFKRDDNLNPSGIDIASIKLEGDTADESGLSDVVTMTSEAIAIDACNSAAILHPHKRSWIGGEQLSNDEINKLAKYLGSVGKVDRKLGIKLFLQLHHITSTFESIPSDIDSSKKLAEYFANRYRANLNKRR